MNLAYRCNGVTLQTRSSVSKSTRSGASSTAADAAAARAESAKARLVFAEKEIRMRIETLQLEASMEMLAIEKEVAIAEAKAGVLETAATNSEEGHSCKLPLMMTPYNSSQRTRDYINEQGKVCEERRLAQELDPAFQDQAKRSNTEPPTVCRRPTPQH